MLHPAMKQLRPGMRSWLLWDMVSASFLTHPKGHYLTAFNLRYAELFQCCEIISVLE